MNISAIQKFEEVLSVILFSIDADDPITAASIEKNEILGMTRSRINVLLSQMVNSGYLQSSGGYGGKSYTPTQKTMNIFGAKNGNLT